MQSYFLLVFRGDCHLTDFLHKYSQYIHDRRPVVLWMAGVCEALGLCRQSLYRGINFLDRTCTMARVPKDRLRTFAAACLLIASKMQDQFDHTPPGISNFVELDETGKNSILTAVREEVRISLPYGRKIHATCL
jgi:hypothetical protein